MAKLNALLTQEGVPINYDQDRAAIDTGLHLFIEGPNKNFEASQARVWFQVKGKRSTTLSAEKFDTATVLSESVKLDHLRFWYAAPQPVYLVIYVESKDRFIAEDVRNLVHWMWPEGDFFRRTRNQESVVVKVRTSQILDQSRLKSMLAHRSMRIDGATFQGRPLGHLYDPLRSEFAINTERQWGTIVQRVLAEYRFRAHAESHHIAEGIESYRGRFYDTLVWQSSAFSTLGFDENDDFRRDPEVQYIQGDATVIIDSMQDREQVAGPARSALEQALNKSESPITLFFFGKDLSATGGTWRRFFREDVQPGRPFQMIGIEAIPSIVLAATMVYLDLAPDLSFSYVNYRY